MNRMAEALSSLYNVEQVLNFMEEDPDDVFDEVFFPGSGDKLGLFEDDIDGSDNGSDDSNDEHDGAVNHQEGRR